MGPVFYFLVGVPQRKESGPYNYWEVLVPESEAKMPECSVASDQKSLLALPLSGPRPVLGN